MIFYFFECVPKQTALRYLVNILVFARMARVRCMPMLAALVEVVEVTKDKERNGRLAYVTGIVLTTPPNANVPVITKSTRVEMCCKKRCSKNIYLHTLKNKLVWYVLE